MTAQRRQIESLFGDAAQRTGESEEEALLQGKFASVPRAEFVSDGETREACDAATTARDAKAPVQREIGDGTVLIYGHDVYHISNRRYNIASHNYFRNELWYILKDSGGSTHWAKGSDPNYNLDGVFPNRTPISFKVARRESGPRTNTYFDDPVAAMKTLMMECQVPGTVAQEMVNKRDWSYPHMQSLMEFLKSTDTVQPGYNEGVLLWKSTQPSSNYSIRTTGRGTQLAQIVGCHMMEYQETNNATQGPRTHLDKSRRTQLEFSESISMLPSEQIPLNTLGIGGGKYSGMFPAMFDVKYEDAAQSTFTQPASGKIYKIFQSAVKARNERFGHDDTLDPEARWDRKEALMNTLAGEVFEFDSMKEESLPEKKKKNRTRAYDDESSMEAEVNTPQSFLAEQLGLTGNDSDNSMEEDECWEFPHTLQSVGAWTLQEFYQYVYKTNVYSGVISKEYSAKLAELDIMGNHPAIEFDTSRMQQIDVASVRRHGVLDRVDSFNHQLSGLFGQLGIDVGRMYQLIAAWEKKKTVLAQRENGLDRKANKTARLRGAELDAYMKKSLLTLKAEGYPLPLPQIGPKTLND